MKTHSFASVLAAAVLAVGTPALVAQEPVSTGTIQGVVPKAGTLTLRSDQTTRPITFYGMDRANIFTADGKPALVGDLQPGMKVTIQYAIKGERWYISKVLLPEQRPAVVTGAPVNLDPALISPALRDGDITTQPGAKAAVDGDITTKPTGNAAVDGDITTNPASDPNAGLRRRAP
jgi:hypothetical protein